MGSSKPTYDSVIAGGGLAGCVVASRLKKYLPKATYLLIEAGPRTRTRTDIFLIGCFESWRRPGLELFHSAFTRLHPGRAVAPFPTMQARV